MANHTVDADEVGVHEVTLTAATVDTITIEGSNDPIELLSDGAASVFYTLDGSTPTVRGANCRQLPAFPSAVTKSPRYSGSLVVKLISAGTPTISVQRDN